VRVACAERRCTVFSQTECRQSKSKLAGGLEVRVACAERRCKEQGGLHVWLDVSIPFYETIERVN
jgi:hypothetical protein